MANLKKISLSAFGFLVFLILWELFAQSDIVAHSLIPAPSSLPGALQSEVEFGFWQSLIVKSLSHYSIGLLIGTFLGISFGAISALIPTFAVIQSWIIRIIRPIPPLAWIPFAIIWFGVSQSAAAFIIAIGIFWINYFATLSAVESVDKDLIEVAKAFNHRSFFAKLIKVIFPAASAGILAGIRTGLGQGWMSVIAAELFGIMGIGQRMIEASGLLATDIVLLYMLTIGGLYAITDLIFVMIQNRILKWQK